MNFILYNLHFILACFAAIAIYTMLGLLIVVPISFLLGDESSRLHVYLSTVVGFIYQTIFWGLWAAYCVRITFAIAPSETTWLIVYLLFGLWWCVGLIRWLGSKEMVSARTIEEMRFIKNSTEIYEFITAVLFVVFSIWPSVMRFIYGWALDYIIWI